MLLPCSTPLTSHTRTQRATAAVHRDFPRQNDRINEATKTSASAGRDAGGDPDLRECVGLCAAARRHVALPHFFRNGSSGSSCASSRARVSAASQPAETGASTRRVSSLVLLLLLLLLCSRWVGASGRCCPHRPHGRLGTEGRGGDRDVFPSGLRARRSRPAHGRRPAGAAVGRSGHRGPARLQGDTGIGELFCLQRGGRQFLLSVGWMQLPHNCQPAETLLLGFVTRAFTISPRLAPLLLCMHGCSLLASADYWSKAASRACISLSAPLGEGATYPESSARLPAVVI